MEMMKRLIYLTALCLAVLSCAKSARETLRLSEATQLLSFELEHTFKGVIDPHLGIVNVTVPSDYAIGMMTVTGLSYSEGARCSFAVGDKADFSHPQGLRLSAGDVVMDYTILVSNLIVEPDVPKPEVIFVGLANSIDGLKPEEKSAAAWMISTIPNSRYVSFMQILYSEVDLSKLKVVWWHFHADEGIDSNEKFNAAAASAVTCSGIMKNYFEGGVSFLLTRYATYYAAALGATLDGRTPNNCWGGQETTGEITGGPWDFKIAEGKAGHYLYQNLKAGEDAGKVYTCDAGYRMTNTTAQWHIGTNWGGYDDLAAWRSNHGAVELGLGGDGSVSVWEYEASGGRGKMLCIGSGCYDWYSHNTVVNPEGFHANVLKMTENAINAMKL